MTKISKQRQMTYYIGNSISLIGFLLFISAALQFAGLFNGPSGLMNLLPSSPPNIMVEIDGQEVVMMPNPNGSGFTPNQVRPSPLLAFIVEPNPAKPFLSILLIIIGQIVANIGRSGLAGSGLVLDPERARQELQPFNVAKGQMINDALQEIDVVQSLTDNHQPAIKVRCRACRALNDETANFCSSCGEAMA